MQKIGAAQAGYLILSYMVSSVFITIPAPVAKQAKGDAWIAVLIAYLLALPLGLLVVWLGNKYPGRNLYQICEMFVGKLLSRLIAFLAFFSMLYFTALIERLKGFLFTSSAMSETPQIVFITCCAILAVYLLRSGIEVMARFNTVAFTGVLIAIIFTCIFAFPLMTFSNIQPLFFGGLKPIYLGIKEIMGINLLYVMLLGVLLPYINDLKLTYGEVLKGGVIGGLILTLVTLTTILVLGAADTARALLPVLTLSKLLVIGDFIRGLEALLLMPWTAAIFMEIALFYFVTLESFKYIFNLDNFNGLLWPMALIVSSLAMYPNDIFVHREESLFVVKYLILPFSTIVPVGLAIMIKIKELRQC